MITSTKEYAVGVVLFIAGVVVLALDQPIGGLLLIYPGWVFFVSVIGEGTRRGIAVARDDELIAEFEDEGPTRA